LVAKIDGFGAITHFIPLNAEDLQKALHGGFCRILAVLGKRHASLDTRARTKVITVAGSFDNLLKARYIFQQEITLDKEQSNLNGNATEPGCVVCHTEAEDTYRTLCGHFYCGACFAQQCSSAGESDIPIHCLGDSGHCSQVFDLRELQIALSSNAFEQLLKHSFTTHIRKHPKEYQYCPTPDCPQVYHTSADGAIFNHPGGLILICTTYQVTNYDGQSAPSHTPKKSQEGKSLT